MPWPLSSTSMKTDTSSLDVLMVIKPSFPSGIDCAALTIKFNNTWLICDGAHSTKGKLPKSSCMVARFLIWLLAIFKVDFKTT